MGGRLLLVDDEPDVLNLIQSILSEGGYQVVVATSADLAIQAFGRMPQRPDLVLTDVVMPGISGPMLIDRLLALDPHLRRQPSMEQDRRGPRSRPNLQRLLLPARR